MFLIELAYVTTVIEKILYLLMELYLGLGFSSKFELCELHIKYCGILDGIHTELQVLLFSFYCCYYL